MPLLALLFTMHTTTNCNEDDHRPQMVFTSTVDASSTSPPQRHCPSNDVTDFNNSTTQDEPPPYYLTPKGYYIGQDAAVSIDTKEKRDEKWTVNIGEQSLAAASELRDPPYDAREEKHTMKCGFMRIGTRCAIIGLVLSIIVLAGGACMVTGSALVSNQCTDDCNGDPNISNRCSTVCSQSLHKGLLITGILIIIFAAISTTAHFIILLAIPFVRWIKNCKQAACS